MKTNAFRRFLWAATMLAALPGGIASAAPLVKTVPWVAGNPLVPHPTYSTKTITLKGTCDRAGANLKWTWDFGDGSAVATGTVTNQYVVEASHAYSAPDGTVFTARLTIQDTLSGETGTNVYYVTVQPKSLEVEVNTAIDQGLWYLWKTATRSGGRYNWHNGNPNGYSDYTGNSTASAVRAFEGQGHLENQPDNPYSEAVRGGIDYLTAYLGVQTMSLQGGADPDSNGNRIGLFWSIADRPIYETGAVMDALVASGTPNATARTGNASYVLGKTYQTIVQDMVDMYAWGQGDAPWYGAWQYSWNSGPDNAASQWAAIGMIAAERHFGCTVPQWVKDRNLPWLDASYNSGGYFGYTSTSPNRWYSTSPCGMVQLSFDGKDVTDSKWAACTQRIADEWGTFTTVSDARYYAWYSFAKAMRVALPTPVDTLPGGKKWYGDNVNGLARLLVNSQGTDGSWPYDNWPYIGYQTTVAWNLIILSPTPGTLEAWRQTYFGSPTNTGNGANTADPDQDGLNNLLEFAFGLHPLQPSAGQAPQWLRGSSNFTCTFSQPAQVSGITYGAEWSPTMAAGTWQALADTGTPPQHTFSTPIGSNTKKFVRIKVMVP